MQIWDALVPGLAVSRTFWISIGVLESRVFQKELAPSGSFEG